MEKENIYYSTGKRKTSVARTWLTPGSGEIIINNKPIDEYFTIESLKGMVKHPLVLTNTLESFNVKSSVVGGGIAGQAGAVRHGITKGTDTGQSGFEKSFEKSRICSARCQSQGTKKIRAKRCSCPFPVLETLEFFCN